MRILFIFIDGLGIGEKDVSKNPCAHKNIRLFNNFLSDSFPKQIPFNGLAKSIECSLGIPGLPQSATGQAALYTGMNASKILNRHLSGFPNQKLRDILEKHSILKKLNLAGKKAAFINAYRPIFFEKGAEALIRFLSVTSIMNWKAGLKFFNFDDLRKQKCIYHDFTNREPIKLGFNIPEFTASIAAKILSRASEEFDFCLYEYFRTDRAGHSQNLQKAISLLIELETFIFTVLKQSDLSKTTIILTSDHGNIEDISVKSHTKNPVLFMVWGPLKNELSDKINSILDVTPVILNMIL